MMTQNKGGQPEKGPLQAEQANAATRAFSVQSKAEKKKAQAQESTWQRTSKRATGVDTRSWNVLQIITKLERLKMAKVPTIATSWQRGHYVCLHDSFLKSSLPNMQQYAGEGNWALAHAAFLAIPDIHSTLRQYLLVGTPQIGLPIQIIAMMLR